MEASLLLPSNTLIAGPRKPNAYERRSSGLGEAEWRKSPYAGTPSQSIASTTVSDSSPSSWLNSRLRLREPPAAATLDGATQSSSNTSGLVSTRDVVKWRALLGDDAEQGDLNQTPRALSPIKAKVEEMVPTELTTTGENDEAKGVSTV